ncbi:phenazine biosynthesis protein PhzF [Aureimonas sp. Leaf454]|uniref:PhzF family phenazine biosynthesis protein n=1 Tax=Aureimonas sp. Leaf454 TaxID=1736381 RepID=UPI0006FEE68C|nr:PhzF family phenazine biosynthesis protein [Aureimonas sp. Leaf454]KQT53120.1 phenazine biosynthesis protein PhzF [Aureimonas sp. Leaf454]
MSRPFLLVDVFASGPWSGNPLGVVAAAEGIGAEEMQTITRWLNLSETVFLLEPTEPAADYRVRIFAHARELPFAGHPTLGAAHAFLALGGQPKGETILQECGVGLVPIRRSDDEVSGNGDATGNGDTRLAFAAPPLMRSGPADEAEIAEILEVLRLPREAVLAAQWVDNGPGWVAVLLGSAEAVLAVSPAGSHHRGIDIGIVGRHPPGHDADWEIRAIFSDARGTLMEDPVTGSLNASVAQWLYASGRASGPYVAAQGTRLGRTGRVFVTKEADGRIWVGGRCRTCFFGETVRGS